MTPFSNTSNSFISVTSALELSKMGLVINTDKDKAPELQRHPRADFRGDISRKPPQKSAEVPQLASVISAKVGGKLKFVLIRVRPSYHVGDKIVVFCDEFSEFVLSLICTNYA